MNDKKEILNFIKQMLLDGLALWVEMETHNMKHYQYPYITYEIFREGYEKKLDERINEYLQ